MNSPMGQWIYNLSKSPEVESIVEVGTWFGLGSTYCIKRGLQAREKPIQEGYSIECDHEWYKEACRNLDPLPDNFHLLYGSIISYDDLKFFEREVKGSTHRRWLEADLKKVKDAPFVEDVMEDKVIDLCILDGGEFSGLFDFFRLGVHSKYVVLDDTTTTKHRETRSYVLNSDDWEVLVDDLTDRNGYMICKNKKV